MKPTKLFSSLLVLTLGVVGLWAPVSAMAAVPTSVVISQVYGGGGNSGATYKNDFIELFNPTASAINVTGWSVQYGSSGGTTWAVTNLSGTIAPGGYYLVQEAQGSGGTVSLPTPDATGTIAMSATTAKVALVKVTTALTGACPSSTNIVDLVGFGAANCSEPPPVGALSNTTAALRKGNGCVDTGNNLADFRVLAPNPRNSASATFDCSLFVPPTAAAIHDIQGSGARSPLADKDVTTTGIVTARKFNGFFMQEADGAGDGDPATSEGIFVFTSSAPPATAAVGNMLSVTATVQEFVPGSDPMSPPTTELIGADVSVVSTGNALPTPITLAPNAAGAADQLERYEGMRVRVDGLTVVGPTQGSVNETAGTSSSNGVFYGVIDGVARPFREEGVSVYDTQTLAATIPRFDENPERIRVDSDALFATTDAVEVTTGAHFGPITGPLDFADRTYTIDPETKIVATSQGIQQARAVRLANGDEFTVASFNMERFFNAQELPLIAASTITHRLNKATLGIINVLNLPDILGIEEMGNINSLQALATKVNTDAVAAGKADPQYAAYLVEGNDVGGIDVGFLVKSARVNVVSVTQEGKDTLYTPPGGTPALLNDRPPLVLRAVVGTAPLSMPVTVIVNHLRSLSDVETDARVRLKRATQAQFLANLIQSLQASNPLENIVSVGDYNAFEVNDGYADVMGIIRGEPASADKVLQFATSPVSPVLTDLVKTLPQAEQYSYSFGGNAQVLDHVLVNVPLMGSKTDFMYARNNADFNQILWADGTRSERLSDHDMPVAYFTLVDSTQPTISCGTADGQWHADNVTISCTAADGGSGLADDANAAFTLATTVAADDETANAATDSKSVCDKQNNCGDAGPIGGNMIDKKKPALSATATTNGANYTSGWTNHDVVVTFHCTDGGSGVASLTSPTTVSDEGNGQVVGGTCADNVGNQSTASFTGIDIDKTMPVVAVTGVSNGATYLLGSVPAASCSTTDVLSGVATSATVKVTGGTANGVGLFTATCSGATDNAGNATAPVAVSYTVAYGFSGFAPPVANRSTFKAGSTIPLKWQLTNATGGAISTLSSVQAVQFATNGACEGEASGAPIDAGDAGNSGLRYGGGQFLYNWQTKGLAAGCYNILLKLDDTTTQGVVVQLR